MPITKYVLALLLCLSLAGPAYAAFPVVAASATTADTDGDTTVVAMPASISAGDMLTVHCAHSNIAGLAQFDGPDWTLLETTKGGSDYGKADFAKIAAGSEGLVRCRRQCSGGSPA